MRVRCDVSVMDGLTGAERDGCGVVGGRIRALTLPARIRELGWREGEYVLIDGEELFVTSANFSDAAQHRDVRSPVVAGQALRFFESLVESEFYARAVQVRQGSVETSF